MDLNDLIYSVRNRFYRGMIDEELKKNTKDLAFEVKKHAFDLSNPLTLKAASLCAEVNDYLGDFRAAKKAVSNGNEVMKSLPTEVTTTNIERLKLIREQVRYVLNWCQSLYRENLYTKSLMSLQECEEIICEKGLARDGFECWGTRAKVHHLKARVESAYGDGKASALSYRRAIEAYQRAAERKSKVHEGNEERVRAELIFMQRRVAVCVGIGMSFLNSFYGRLLEALDNVRVAETLLMPSMDHLKKAQVKLRYATILRGFARPDDEARLRESVLLATEALSEFDAHGHLLYSIRACWELALAFLYKGDDLQAEAYWRKLGSTIDEMREQTGHEDSYWRVNHWLLNSRILRRRGDFPGALDAAEKGIKYLLPSKANLRLGHIDCLVAKSEALYSATEYKEAIETLREAREIMLDEPSMLSQKTEAAIHLHLARNYIKLANTDEARRCLDRSRELMEQIEDKSVEYQATEVNEQLMSVCKDFEILGDARSLRYWWWQDQLQQWLVARASERFSSNESQMLSALGIARRTLNEWRAKWHHETKKKAMP